MQNWNYNLLKLLHGKLDDHWRIMQHYADDAKKSGCADCQKILEEILKNDEKQIEMIKKEMEKHISEGKFD